MNFSSIIHEPKSALSYAYDDNTLHIRLKTAKDDIKKVEILAVDPFNWIPRNDGTLIYDFDKESVIHVLMQKEQVTKYYDCWFAEVPDITWKRTKYCFILENDSEKYIMGSHDWIPYSEDQSILYNLFNYFNYPYINEEDIYKAPDWVPDTVWYQVFPERFCNGSPTGGRDLLPWGSDEMDRFDKKFGGDLLGIIKKLDYIKDVGFNGIYLNPIFKSPSSHKYDTTDYFTIDPEFGDNETFRILVEEAHKRGIKVMLDAVFNHCGYLHPYWQDVLKNGANSRYYDCFYIMDPERPLVYGELEEGIPGEAPKESLNYRTFAYAQAMPKWNTGNPIAREYLLNVGCYWIEKYHIDGWRLDVSNEVSHDFWIEFRKRVKSINPEVYILGENWDNSYPWLQGDQFDAVMNYELAIPAWNFFRANGKEEKKYDAQDFQYAISKLLTDYPKHITKNLFNLLDSHDTERILNIVGNNIEIVKLAYIFLFTFPGTPCIYYGSEVGMSGDEHSNRQCMVWEGEKQNIKLSTFIHRLIELRKKHESFKTTEFRWIPLETDSNTVLYKKETDQETLYVLIHNEDKPVDLSLPEELKGLTCKTGLQDNTVTLTEKIIVEPYGYMLYLMNK